MREGRNNHFCQAEDSPSLEEWQKGDKIEVMIRGNLKELDGEVIQVNNGKSKVFVRIEILGSAKMTIGSINLQRIV